MRYILLVLLILSSALAFASPCSQRVIVDGQFSEWDLNKDLQGESSSGYSYFLRADGAYLHIGINAGSLLSTKGQKASIFIDTDNDPRTGCQDSVACTRGADHLVEIEHTGEQDFFGYYRYTGEFGTAGWTQIGAPKFSKEEYYELTVLLTNIRIEQENILEFRTGARIRGEPIPKIGGSITFVRGSCDGDADGDGFLGSVDCDDTNPFIYPGGPERCDGVDNDCNPETKADYRWPTKEHPDLSFPKDGYVYTCDLDNDGFSEFDGDCDDSLHSDRARTTYPGAIELDDGVDNDCDGSYDERCGNGVLEPGEECDDGNLAFNDGCNGLCMSENHRCRIDMERTLAKLDDFRGVNKKDRRELYKAVNHIKKSLDESIELRFKDQCALHCPKQAEPRADGKKLFDNQQLAIYSMMRIRNPSTDVTEAIRKLVESHRTITFQAIKENPDCKANHVIKEVDRGDNQRSLDRPDKASSHYRKAWQIATSCACAPKEDSCITRMCVESSSTLELLCTNEVQHPTTTFMDADGKEAEFHTSCNRCLSVGDTIGSFEVVGVEEKNDPVFAIAKCGVTPITGFATANLQQGNSDATLVIFLILKATLLVVILRKRK
jgi:cysteine-rich repeat protein